MSMVMGFDGINGYANCGAGGSLNINGANQLTVCMRFKMNRECPTGSWGFLSKDNDVNLWQYMLYIQATHPNSIGGSINDGVGSDYTSFAPVNINTIYHVTFVLTAARLKIYVNGVEYLPPGIARTRNPANQAGWSLYLGKYGGSRFGAINVYEVQVYNRDLSDTEINYNVVHPNNPKRLGCVLNLTQESLFGGQWKDLSGNANHGTLVGGAAPIPSNNLAGRQVSL